MRINNPQLLVKPILIILLIIMGIFIYIKAGEEVHIIEAPEPTITNTVTPTPSPTVIITPTPTVTTTPTYTATPTPLPTNTPTPEPTATPTPTPVKELETFSSNEKTLYNTYSEEELDLLFRVVEAEVTDHCIECKSHVASVIFNRLKAGWCGGDLTKNLMAKRQFEVVTNGRYKKMTITEETILACEIAFESDTAQGALFFDSTKGKSWAHKNREYMFSDHAHWFYK
jgi:spore germination cell wall hydrolase CwlJ-like protein